MGSSLGFHIILACMGIGFPAVVIRLLAVAAVVALSQAFNKDLTSVYKKFATPVGVRTAAGRAQ